MSGEPATGQRLLRAAASHSQSRKQQAAKRGRPASKGRASCAVCKVTLCKLGCPGRVKTGQDAASDARMPCRKSRTGVGDQGEEAALDADGEASRAVAGGVRGQGVINPKLNPELNMTRRARGSRDRFGIPKPPPTGGGTFHRARRL